MLDIKKIKIAFLASGGAGNMFIYANFILSFKQYFSNVNFDICVFGHKSQELNKLIFDGCDFINEYYDYSQRGNVYFCDAGIELTYLPDVLFVNENVRRVSIEMYDLLVKWNEYINSDSGRKYCTSHPFCNYLVYVNGIINKKNVLNTLDVFGDLGIKRRYIWKLEVKDNFEILNKNGLEIGEYITLQRGATPGIDSTESPKIWPVEHYEEFIRIIKRIYPHKKIVQLGESSNSIRLKGVDVSLLDKTSWEDLGMVLKYSWLHVDGECGMVHYRAALHAGPSVVLFGSTPIDFYSYDENINIASDYCKYPCARLTNSWNERCALGFSRPKCMDAITPQMVVSRIVAWDILRNIKEGKNSNIKNYHNDDLYAQEYIDKIYREQYLDNMPVVYFETCKRRLCELKAIIMGEKGFIHIPLKDTPAYVLLKGDSIEYDKHISRLQEQYGDSVHTRNRFENLINSIQEKGYDLQSKIIINDKNLILDGNHRGAWLMNQYGEDYEVDVIQICTLFEDAKWDIVPFEKIKEGSNVLIYGASLVGESYIDQFNYTEYAKVIGLIDRFPDKWNCQLAKRNKINCVSPEAIDEGILSKTDCVLLATRNDRNAKEMASIIIKKGFSKDKIISRCRL